MKKFEILSIFNNLLFSQPALLQGKNFLTFSISLLIFSGCRTDINAVKEITTINTKPVQIIKDAEVVYSDSGIVRMKLNAPLMERFPGENPYVEFTKGVNVIFYDDDMEENSRLKADYAIRYEKDSKMEAKRNVEVVNIKAEKLNTEHLIWEDENDRIYTETFVRITTKEEVIYGDGLESNLNFTKYRIKNIKGTFPLGDEDEEEEQQEVYQK